MRLSRQAIAIELIDTFEEYARRCNKVLVQLYNSDHATKSLLYSVFCDTIQSESLFYDVNQKRKLNEAQMCGN